MRKAVVAAFALSLLCGGLIAFRAGIAQGVDTPHLSAGGSNAPVVLLATDTPTVTPTPTIGAGMQTYSVSVSGVFAEATAFCDVGDAVTGGSAGTAYDSPQRSQPVYDDALHQSGWYGRWSQSGQHAVFAVCLDNPPTNTHPAPTAIPTMCGPGTVDLQGVSPPSASQFCATVTPTGTPPITPSSTPCPNGSIDIGAATSPPSYNAHFCATYTPTAGPTSTPGPGGSDSTPPQLLAFDFTPKQVDTTQSSKTITFTARATDDLSGVSSISIGFRAPTSQQTLYAYLNLQSGDTRDGMYQGIGTLQAYSEQGIWEFAGANLSDRIGNYRNLTPTQFAALGFPTSFYNGPGTPPPSPTATPTLTGGADTTPPQLLAFDFTPKSVDTTHASQPITLTVHLTDDLSGVAGLSARFSSANSNQGLYFNLGSYEKKTGSLNDGTFVTERMLPAFSAYGAWNLSGLYISDAIGNSVQLDSTQAQALGFPTVFINGPVGLDTDADGVPDVTDNCPSIANADQLNTDAGNTAAHRPGADTLGDACDLSIAGDGYTNAQHTALNKNPAAYCPIMRADVDGDSAVSILDLTKVAQKFTQSVPPAPERLRQDADAQISILDLTKMAQVFTQNVSACP